MLKNLQLLLIEDNKDDAFIIKNLLKSSNVKSKIVHATSLKDGLSHIGKKFFDMILLDLTLPNGEGIEVFNSIHNKCEEIPIVIVSEFKKNALEAVKLGAQDYLIKPININELFQSINYAIVRKTIENKCKKKYNKVLFDINNRKEKEKNLNNFLDKKLNEWNNQIKKSNTRQKLQIQRLEQLTSF